MWQEITLAIKDYAAAWRFVQIHRLGKLIILSGVLYLLVFCLTLYGVWLGVDTGLDYLLSISWIESTRHFLSRYHWLLTLSKILTFLSTLFLGISIYKYLFLALASPLFAYISERSAEAYTGVHTPFSLTQFLKDILRGILVSVRNAIAQLLITLLLFFLSLFPVIGLLFSVLMISNDAYYYGFSMLDYNCERHKMGIGTSRRFIKQHKGLAIGNGLVMYAALYIPILGPLIVAPLSVVAATLSFYTHTQYTITRSASHPTSSID